MAPEDPDGHLTDGIVRVETSESSFSFEDTVKSSATGGSDAWPTDRYLNKWVCRLSGRLLGYAQFPRRRPTASSSPTPRSEPRAVRSGPHGDARGRPLAEPAAHLGDDGSGCGGTDEVDDRPNQGSEITGRPKFPKLSCDNDPNGDMFVNYMDDTDDAGMFMFTAGQVQMMDACLLAARSLFLELAPAPVVS